MSEVEVACPHWAPGQITMRKGCTACAADLNQQKEGS